MFTVWYKDDVNTYSVTVTSGIEDARNIWCLLSVKYVMVSAKP